MEKLIVNPLVNFIRSYVWLLCLLFYNIGYPQGDNNYNSVGSPEAKNLGSGSDVSNVNTHNGVINTSIPIHNFKGREFDLPISLSYASTGIKVTEVASNVGLGWNLNVGGRITRVVNRDPDQNGLNDPSSSCPREMSNANQDYYKVSVMGFEEIYRYYYSTITIMPYLDPKVIIKEVDGIITVETPDGTTFYFSQEQNMEKMKTINTCGSSYTTSWMLCKIVSKNKLDEYLFTYQSYEWDAYIPDNGGGSSIRSVTSSYKLNQQMVTEIKHNGKIIIGFSYANRDDLTFIGGNGNALSEIRLYNFEDSTLYKKVGFTYSYFGNLSSPNFLDRRLKLDALTFYGVTNTEIKQGDVYSFKYHGQATDMPPITSYARDYLGLYNGKDENLDYIANGHGLQDPNIEIFTVLNNTNRQYNFEKSLTGVLENVTYPNKGFVTYEYEQHALECDYLDYTTPGYYTTAYPSVKASVLDRMGEFQGGCSYEELPQYTNNNPLMDIIYFYNYPFYNLYDSSDRNPKALKDVKTSLIRITEPTDTYIETKGKGVFLIQKIEGCNELLDNADNLICYDSGEFEPTDHAIYNECMIPTDQLFYTGSASSQNNSYVLRGLCYRYDDPTPSPIPLHLDQGVYQVTLWSYNYISEGEEKAQIFIYKYVPGTPIRVWTPPVFHDLDQAANLVDGFRIKEITTYTSSNILAFKKSYKYCKGYMIDGVYNLGSVPNPAFGPSIRNVRFSRGYSSDEIIHYEIVTEENVDVNLFSNRNGYVEYHYRPVPIDDNSFYLKTLEEKKYPFYFSNSRGGRSEPSNVYFSGYYWSHLLSKKIYDKNKGLLYEEVNEYDGFDFLVNNIVNGEMPDFNPYYQKFYFLSKKTSSDLQKGIDIQTQFIYDSDARLISSINDNEVKNYEYDLGYRQNLIGGIESSISGYTKYLYPTHSPSNPVANPYLVNEIKQQKTVDAPIETTAKFSYDDAGNRVETIAFTPGVLTLSSYESTLYGYNNRFAVAKLSGVKYASIVGITNRIQNIKERSNVAITIASEEALRTELNKLRDDFPDAMITTYTYNPVYGVTSMTDPKGYTLYYEYDALGRLQYTKEKDVRGNMVIISESQFNTKPE